MQNLQSLEAPILILTPKTQKGLKIHWNFTGMLEKIANIYHIFIFCEIGAQESLNFYKNYYNSAEMGHLLGIYNAKAAKQREKIIWQEKIRQQSHNEFSNEKILGSVDLLANALGQIFSEVAKKQGLIVVNLITHEDDIKKGQRFYIKINERVSNLRLQRKDLNKVVFNCVYVCDTPQTLSNRAGTFDCLSGLNKLYCPSLAFENYREQIPIVEAKVFAKTKTLDKQAYKNFSEQIEISERKIPQKFHSKLMKYLKILSVKNLQVRIYLPSDINYMSGTNQKWNILDCQNCIQKNFYALPACQTEEYLLLMYKNNYRQQKLTLSIVIDYQLFNNKKIHAKNQVSILTQSEIQMCNTVGKIIDNPYTITKCLGKFQIVTNLLEESNYVWIFSAKDQKGETY